MTAEALDSLELPSRFGFRVANGSKAVKAGGGAELHGARCEKAPGNVALPGARAPEGFEAAVLKYAHLQVVFGDGDRVRRIPRADIVRLVDDRLREAAVHPLVALPVARAHARVGERIGCAIT